MTAAVVMIDRHTRAHADAIGPVPGEPGLYAGFAADLGPWPTLSSWPALISYAREDGITHDFYFRRVERDLDGDITAAIYTTPHGDAVLRLFND